jgi:murein tripeptide amidase MpaA
MTTQSSVFVTANFDAGNIRVVGITNHYDIRLEICDDALTKSKQWFYFQISGVKSKNCLIHILNAGECTFPDGFKDYEICASYDEQSWFRVTTRYDDGILTATLKSDYDTVWLAYFEPYSWARHQALLAKAQQSVRVELMTLGLTIQKRPLVAFKFTLDNVQYHAAQLIDRSILHVKKKQCWIIARQHPGETMAEWCADGMIQRLLDEHDAVSRELLRIADIYIIPNMNPDGSALGHLRTNAQGVDLNRAWQTPDEETSPEVFYVRQLMHKTGVDVFLDLHGDEVLPYVFTDGCAGLPTYTPILQAKEQRFNQLLAQNAPDFQTEHGYTSNHTTYADTRLAAKYIGQTFGCLSLTLEMPFKDNACAPHPQTGWNGQRSQQLGQHLMLTLWHYLRNS